MLLCKEISLTDVTPFKSERVNLTDNDGLVIITGLNKDSKIAKDQINGAGKSVLFSSIPNCRYGSAPSSPTKNSKKDLLSSKSSSIGFKFVDNQNREIQIMQKASRWDIFINGEDQQVHRVEHQMNKMAELFPITEDEFYAYTYLSSINGGSLHFQTCKPAERLKFITSIFNLGDYDKMKKYFTKQLALIKEEQVRFDVIESKLFGVNTQLSRLHWDKDTSDELKRITARLERLQHDLDEGNQTKNKISVQHAELRGLVKRLDRADELKAIVGDKTPDQIKQRLEAAERYQKYLSELRTYDKNSSKVRERLLAIGYSETSESQDAANIKVEYKKVKDKLVKVEQQLTEAKQSAKQYASAQADLETLKSAIKKLGFKSPKDITVPKSLNDDLDICRTTIRLKKLLDSDVDSHCSTCQQPVDIKKISKSVKLAETRLVELLNIKKANDLAVEYKQKKAALVEPSGDVDELKSKAIKLDKRLDGLEADYHKALKISELLDTLAQLEKPTPVKEVTSDIEKLRARLEAHKELKRIVNEVGDLDAAKVRKKIANAEKALSTLNEDLKVVQSKYKKLFAKKANLDTVRGEFQVLRTQKKELEAELEEVKPILAKRDLYKTLEKAWGTKGMKVDAANAVVGLLQDNLNKYRELIFAEPFSFIVYADDSGVFCNVDRNNGTPPTDVRLLSGAESDAFKLLFLLSLLLMADPARRTNLVILDEPDSHMDEPTRALLAQSYLPFLREVVPHIFLISAKDTDVYSDAEIWRVEKHKGKSKLIRGDM